MMTRRTLLSTAAAASCMQMPLARAGNTWKMRAGFAACMFTGMSPGDAKVAANVYVKRIAEDVGCDYEATVFDDTALFIKTISEEQLDFVMISTLDFLRHEKEINLDPFLVVERGDEPEEIYEVKVRKDSGIKDLADLKDKSLLFDSRKDLEMPQMWLNQELRKKGLPRLDVLCKPEYPQAVSQAVLPVFFGKKDACLVAQALFDTVSELNPQVSQRLVTLAKSEPLQSSLICLRKGYMEQKRGIIVQTATALQGTPAGQQLLLLTRARRLSKFRPGLLDNVKKLLANEAPADTTPADPNL